ncbi:hypothetical protein CONCODRAFT_9266 [Conidiobolus coronatus NRRL 28638]|uniref:G-protein coupled receptors family 1 profile domain-containing protein n=1 Tax=Conidiobolus coronatus (strain ATCC 28846 / CBS 209.66 / NRRL 28638) TaxID=796925 RepID=A0A137P095_CONC2|nr:hypothetical protein CONCODRAFT_9266 [Conidiobolus coronatus NRRL 28638]|eukprot:KXN68466.1 hypothetical protein CONCODRAFT_9266 [Conidiobolus coronatus NRRL 28638]
MVIALVGITISSSVLLILMKKNLRRLNIDLQLVALTLLCDIATGLYCIVNSISNFAESDYFLNTRVKCNINATFGIIAAATSFNIVGVIGAERCLLIVYDIQFKKKYYFVLLSLLLLLNFLCILVCWLFNGFGQTPTGIYCMFDLYEIGGKVGSMLLATSCLISLTFVYTGYILIILKRRRRIKKMRQELGEHCVKLLHKKSATLVKSLTIIIVSTFTNLPYCIIVIMSIIDPYYINLPLDMIATTCMILNQVLNTILLLHMRPDILADLKDRFGWINFGIGFTMNSSAQSNTADESQN